MVIVCDELFDELFGFEFGVDDYVYKLVELCILFVWIKV